MPWKLVLLWSGPGAFQRCLYREQLFPTLVFRQAYDRLVHSEPKRADAHYVQLLALAADLGEAVVAEALSTLLREALDPTVEQIRARLGTVPEPTILAVYVPELASYDQLGGPREVSA